MMRFQSLRIIWTLVLLILSILPVSAQQQDELMRIMENELQRELSMLSSQEHPPYFIGYHVTETQSVSVNASFGALTGATPPSRTRNLHVTVRVGDYRMDNTREIRGGGFDFMSAIPSFALIPRDDNPEAIQAALWDATNGRYRKAVERYAKVKANVAVKVAAEDTSADFSREQSAALLFEPPLDFAKMLPEQSAWEEKVRKYTALFLANGAILNGNASFSFQYERKYYVSSEGARIAQNMTYARLFVSGTVKADDGMELPLYRSYFGFTPADLPPDESIMADVKEMIGKLAALRHAPIIDPYTGPAILSGRAAGVFFHEIFGHRIEGHRQKSEDEGQTFKKKIGEKVLPAHLSVVFDPTRTKLGGKDLVGCYQFDDEGVEARPVTVIDRGIFRSFLMSRSPVEGFPNSNGHGRAAAGYQPVARQSNLLVQSTAPVTMKTLRQRLIDECTKQGKPFGLLFQDIEGGFTITGRTIPNAFNVLPTEVYRVYTDGRPDELVRGVDLVGTPLVIFSNINDAADDVEIFNGVCGAESGGVPVSAASPSLLVTQVEVQKKSKSQERPPVLPRPDTEKDKGNF